MFTGIVKAVGTVEALRASGGDLRLRIRAPDGLLDDAKEGDSISVSGVCLTVVEPGAHHFNADVSRETLDRTTLGDLAEDARVNLEPALRLADRLGGHLVSGHVDATARLAAREADGHAERFAFEFPVALARFITPKGSVCIDGVSLTVNGVTGSQFDVCIIPHTQQVTTLGDLRPGDAVNLEVDLVARYLDRLRTSGAPTA